MSKKEHAKKQTEIVDRNTFAVGKKNHILIAIGLGLMMIGFLLMLGGGTKDPNVFDGTKLFSFRRITLSTFFIIAGMVFEVYAIMKRPKAKE